MLKNYLPLLSLLLVNFAVGQEKGRILTGKITAENESVSGINIVNLVTEQYVQSNEDGSFKISAKSGDLLVLTSVHLEVHRHIVEDNDFVDGKLLIKMIPKITMLDETVVNQYSHINAESMGVIPQGQKKYSPAERRLATAGDFKPIHLLGLLGGSLQVDPIINAITGRTAMLKKELEVERKEMLLSRLDLLDLQYFTDKLAIPKEYVEGFKRYVVEDAAFRNLSQQQNRITMEFRLNELATNYNELIKVEK